MSDNPFGDATEQEFQQQLENEGKKSLGKSKRAKEREAKAAAKAARGERATETKPEKAPKVEQTQDPVYCLCGCGGERRPTSSFIPGHDSRAKSVLMKIDRKQIDTTWDEVPADLKEYAEAKWEKYLPHIVGGQPYPEPEAEPAADEPVTEETVEDVEPSPEDDPNFEGYPGTGQGYAVGTEDTQEQ